MRNHGNQRKLYAKNFRLAYMENPGTRHAHHVDNAQLFVFLPSLHDDLPAVVDGFVGNLPSLHAELLAGMISCQ